MTALRVILCVVGALVLHLAVMLFGGIFFMNDDENQPSRRDIELVSEEVDKDKEQEKIEEKVPEEIKTDSEAPPDPNQALQSVESPAADNDAPALDAASLSAIEQALNGSGGSGSSDFGSSASLASGGRIGGTGRAGSEDEAIEGAFSMSEIDQRPRAVHQVPGTYPTAMRSKNIDGVVTLIFVVDETGRVVNPRIEKSSHPEFDAPALEAVRQWKFEPAIKGGQRVSCRMRVPMRFQAKAS